MHYYWELKHGVKTPMNGTILRIIQEGEMV
jgi:hypothetical protein